MDYENLVYWVTFRFIATIWKEFLMWSRENSEMTMGTLSQHPIDILFIAVFVIFFFIAITADSDGDSVVLLKLWITLQGREIWKSCSGFLTAGTRISFKWTSWLEKSLENSEKTK
jgi:hypothetical protein